ncbi:MAG: BrnT family toxin [Myxococcaceae bacterium]
MNELRFEWDDSKSQSNAKKHGVSFEEAQAVFYDEHAIQFYDPDHSEGEDRFIMLGISFKLRVLVVCHCHRENDDVIRII